MQSNFDKKQVKRILREQIVAQYGNTSLDDLDESVLIEDLSAIFARMAKVGNNIPDEERPRLIKHVLHDLTGLGPLHELMQDDTITEIMVNGPYDIYLERGGKTVASELTFDDEQHVRYIIEKMLRPTGRRVDELTPFVDFSLPGGSRVNVILPPVGFGGPYVTIRKFLHDLKTLDSLKELGTLDNNMAEFLQACVKAKVNIMFSGATGSGKTTLLEVLSSDIAEEERIVTIEDTLELNLRQRHVVRLLTRNANIEGKGEISIRDLFINTLRMRPDRIILGEIRGGEALDYLQALNSGHDGAMAVIHASTPEDVLIRLENMTFYSGLNIPASSVKAQIAHGVDIIVQLAQIVDGSRKVVRISEVIESDHGAKTNDLFYFKGDYMDEDKKVHGCFKATGIVPECLTQIENMGVKINKRVFLEV